jgi:hypothetical protein
MTQQPGYSSRFAPPVDPPPGPPHQRSAQWRSFDSPTDERARPAGTGGDPDQVTGPPGTNAFAVASLLFGIIGAVPLGAVFGVIALRQLGRRPQRGRRLAITGLALSGLWLLGIVGVVAMVALAGDRDTGVDAAGSGDGAVSSFALRPGDCLNGLTESDKVTSIPAVPCADPHEGEVFALFELGGTWQGDAAVTKQAESGCLRRLAEYAPAAVDDNALEIFFLHPNERSWAQGDRAVTCVAMDPAKREGSLRD